MSKQPGIIIALDVKSLSEVEYLVNLLMPFGVWFKIGLELISSVGGPQAVKFVQDLGGRVFYDGKFKDIPNTVAEASRAIAALGVEMIDVHIDSGGQVLKKTMEAVKMENPNTKVLGVTILTSIGFDDLLDIGYPYINPMDPRFFEEKAKIAYVNNQVCNLLNLAADCGLDGVVLSPQELIMASRWWYENPQCQQPLLKVTPGIRPQWATPDDQNRFTTPWQAASDGADYLVIGRPVIKPPPEIGGTTEALTLILSELDQLERGKYDDPDFAV